MSAELGDSPDVTLDTKKTGPWQILMRRGSGSCYSRQMVARRLDARLSKRIGRSETGYYRPADRDRCLERHGHDARHARELLEVAEDHRTTADPRAALNASRAGRNDIPASGRLIQVSDEPVFSGYQLLDAA